MMTERAVAPLTILVPTYNRPVFLLRLLRYYRRCGAPFPLRVLDSSPTTPAGELDEALREPPVVYRRYDPHMGPISKLSDGLQDVETPYVVLWADDDFLVPGTVSHAAAFLTAHQEFSVAHGCGGLFRLTSASEPHVRMEVGPFVQRSCTAATATTRLLEYAVRGGSIFYSVRRTANVRMHMAQCCRHGFEYYWGELALAWLAVIEGKTKRLDNLYILRQMHEARGSGWSDVGLYDYFDWVTRTDFPARYEALRECVAEALTRQEAVTVSQAREVVKEAFWAYLAKQMATKWANRQGGVRNASFRSALRSAARGLPGVRQTWRAVQSYLPGERHQLSLEALLRPSSRYHRDFLPVYETVVGHRNGGGV